MDDEIPKHRAKKNKKKWCKGRVGKEHDPMWMEDDRHIYPNRDTRPPGTIFRLIYKCQNCNKELDKWWVAVGNEWWQKGYIKPEIGQREPMQKKDK